MKTGVRASVVVGLVGVIVALPTQASADNWVSGFIGKVFGGSTGSGLSEAVENSSDTTYGFSVGAMRAGIVGGEFDFGYTPRFFGEAGTVSTSSVITSHGSLLLGAPIGGQYGASIRPYGAIGVGMIRRQVEFSELFTNVSTADFGYNVGLGVMGFFNNVFGLRGEYRYFRNFQKDDDGSLPLERGTFSFSRGTFGVVIRF